MVVAALRLLLPVLFVMAVAPLPLPMARCLLWRPICLPRLCLQSPSPPAAPPAHADAPDENLPVSMYRLARKAWVHYLVALGEAAAAAAEAKGATSDTAPEADDRAAAAEAEGSAERTADRGEL